MTDEFQYRDCIIRVNPRSSAGRWTHDGVVEHHLGYAVDDHLFCAPGRSTTRAEAVKVIVVYGKGIIDAAVA